MSKFSQMRTPTQVSDEESHAHGTPRSPMRRVMPTGCPGLLRGQSCPWGPWVFMPMGCPGLRRGQSCPWGACDGGSLAWPLLQCLGIRTWGDARGSASRPGHQGRPSTCRAMPGTDTAPSLAGGCSAINRAIRQIVIIMTKYD